MACELHDPMAVMSRLPCLALLSDCGAYIALRFNQLRVNGWDQNVLDIEVGATAAVHAS